MVLAGLTAITNFAEAAQIKAVGTIPNEGEKTKIVLNGKIVPGDAPRLQKLLEPNYDAILFLNSSGGDYREGLALAHLLHDKLIPTALEPGASCLSACAIAFLGGNSLAEEDLTMASRSIPVGATLGFHAPYLRANSQPLTDEAVLESYDQAIKTVTDFVRSASGFGITPDVAADMMTPQRDSLYYVRTMDDLRRIGIEVQGIEPAKKLTPSMVKNICANGLVAGDTTFQKTYDDMERMLKDLKWDIRATIPIRTGYFGDIVKGSRVVVPMYVGGEGIGEYSCVVDAVVIDGNLRASDRGYIFTNDGGNILESAKHLDRGPESYGDPEIPSKFAVGAADPLSDSLDTDILRLELVPPDTLITDISDKIRSYEIAEPAIKGLEVK